MKKFFKILCVNFLSVALILLFFDVLIWICHNINLKERFKSEPVFYEYSKNYSLPRPYFRKLCHSVDNREEKRTPSGLSFKKPPIIVFGCSFAYGSYLEDEQTFSYKLSKLTKRPVYNEAFPGQGVQHMLYLLQNPEFYKKEEPEYCIYLYMSDHIRRLYAPTCSNFDILDGTYNLIYKEKKGKLVLDKIGNDIVSYIKMSYLSQFLIHLYLNKFYLKNEKNQRNIAKYFIESKNEAKKHWKNTKFIVIIYDKIQQGEYIKSELEKNDIKMIYMKDLTKERLSKRKYSFPDTHPKEKAWDLLTPLVVKELNL